MPSLEDVASELAEYLLAHPGDDTLSIWRHEGDWGWSLDGSIPPGADFVIGDRLDRGDADPDTDPGRAAVFAGDLLAWVHEALVGPHLAGRRSVEGAPVGRDEFADHLRARLERESSKSISLTEGEAVVFAELLSELAAIYSEESLGVLATDLASSLYERARRAT